MLRGDVYMVLRFELDFVNVNESSGHGCRFNDELVGQGEMLTMDFVKNVFHMKC